MSSGRFNLGPGFGCLSFSGDRSVEELVRFWYIVLELPNSKLGLPPAVNIDVEEVRFSSQKSVCSLDC
jgi:hypothetical protein